MNSLQWLQMILSYFVQVSLVIGLAWGLERWTHASHRKAQVWTACFVSLLGLLAAALLLPRLNWFDSWSRLGPRELLTVADTESVLGRVLLAGWLLGAAVMVCRWVFQYAGLHHFIRGCDPCSQQEVAIIHDLADPGDLVIAGREIEFRVSPENLGPFCYQLHRPMIFLPASLVRGDRVRLRQVLVHELTHLKTQHPVQLLLQKTLQTVLWFHPLLWMAGRRASLVREFVCDDLVVDDGGATASYLQTLVEIVERRGEPQSGTLAVGRSASQLRQRAVRLVHQAADQATSDYRWLALVPIVAAVIVSQCWLPTNPLASGGSRWTPWPSWSASVLHTFDVPARDFERFDGRSELYELMEDRAEEAGVQVANKSARDELH